MFEKLVIFVWRKLKFSEGRSVCNQDDLLQLQAAVIELFRNTFADETLHDILVGEETESI